jgi:ElaB/YqjD/DUF883 family membrane-anchored ribosome-binding protein
VNRDHRESRRPIIAQQDTDTIMTNPGDDSTDLATLRADMTSLRRDVSSLLGHLKTGAVNGVQDAVADMNGRARAAYGGIADGGERSAREIGRQVGAHPLFALVVAAGIGFVGGRVLSR